MPLRIWLVCLLAILVLVAAPVSYQEPNDPGPGVVRTQHFTITYDAKTLRKIARYSAEGIEAAYRYFVIQHGFRYSLIPRGDLKLSFDTNMAPLPAEYVRSLQAHEFFHDIQVLGYSLRSHDLFFMEGTAMWAEREVFPLSRESYTQFLDEWLIGGTDARILQQLSYQGGLFWNFVTARYGGAQLVRRLFEHPDIRQGDNWAKVLSALVGKPFLDLWAEFAVALAACQVPDAKFLYPRAEQKTIYVPVPVFVGEWTGQTLNIEQVNWQTPYLQFCRKWGGTCPPEKNIPVVGDKLTVRHPYGIHFLRITPQSEVPLVLRFEGDAQTDFRVFGVGFTHSGKYESFPITEACVIPKLSQYKLLQIVVTRGEAGTGKYRLRLEAAQGTDYPRCSKS